MGTSSIFLCILFLCGALGLTTPPPPARGRLRCYTCSFAKPCYPVPTECQDDEACGISIGTSGRTWAQWPFSQNLHPSIHPAFPAAPASAFSLCPTEQNEIIER
uniref:Lymphocyte antigen 6G6e-like n=1 Tax=Ailuropoda melanoleuca TaxID=9646 RepID=G1LRI8_AILME